MHLEGFYKACTYITFLWHEFIYPLGLTSSPKNFKHCLANAYMDSWVQRWPCFFTSIKCVGQKSQIQYIHTHTHELYGEKFSSEMEVNRFIFGILSSFKYAHFLQDSLKWDVVCSVFKHIWVTNFFIKELFICQVVKK